MQYSTEMALTETLVVEYNGQFLHLLIFDALLADEYVPCGQGISLPEVHQAPGEHSEQLRSETKPEAFPYVPSGQLSAAADPSSPVSYGDSALPSQPDSEF